MRRKTRDLAFAYLDLPERRTVTLERDGIRCVPILGFDRYRQMREPPDPHVHEGCIEISYCFNGDIEFEKNGRTRIFRPGMVALSAPGVVHRFRNYPKGMGKYWMLFRLPPKGASALGLTRVETGWLVGRLLAMKQDLFFGGERIRSDFQRLWNFYDREPTGCSRRVRIRLAVQALILDVLDAESRPVGLQQADSSGRVTDLVKAIAAAPGEDWSVERLCADAAVSESVLLNRFKSITGLPPHAYVLHCRIAEAKVRLRNGLSDTITQMAQELGFSNAQHFATSFKDATGLTPSEFAGKVGADV